MNGLVLLRPLDFEVYAVRSIAGQQAQTTAVMDFRPLYRTLSEDEGNYGRYFSVRREPRLGSGTSRKSGTRLRYAVEIESRAGAQMSLMRLPLVLSACGIFSGGSGPPQKEFARLDIAISADRDLNTDTKGRGAPMLLRVFELKSEVAFQEADFFALQNTAKAVLGADLLAMDQFIIRPGETREIKRKANPETTAIGIFAGYRDLPNAVWRVVHRMPPAPDASWYRAVIPSGKTALKIDLQGNAIVMTDEDAGTRPTQFANESPKGLDQNPLDAARQEAKTVSKEPDALSQGAAKGPEKPAADGVLKNLVEGIKKPFSSLK